VPQRNGMQENLSSTSLEDCPETPKIQFLLVKLTDSLRWFGRQPPRLDSVSRVNGLSLGIVMLKETLEVLQDSSKTLEICVLMPVV